MDFGKLPSVDGVDFTLPNDPPENAALLSALSPGPLRVYVGATGYAMKAWVGRWYAPGTSPRQFLAGYGRQFNTIEHNSTHYRLPDAAEVARWRAAVPDDFRFCPKVPQGISHARRLGVACRDMERFCRVIVGLGDRLGCCFLQLPPHFGPQRLGDLGRFLEVFAGQLPLSVEVRHAAFFSDAAAGRDLFDMLQALEVAAVITDVAGRRDVCHLRLTAVRTLIRFVGNGLHPTDFSRTREWAERLSRWAALREIYFFCHEPDNLLAPELAVYAVAAFRQRLPQASLRGPSPVEPSGRQTALFA